MRTAVNHSTGENKARDGGGAAINNASLMHDPSVRCPEIADSTPTATKPEDMMITLDLH